MDWRAWFARDSVLWQVCFYLGVIASAITALADPTSIGIPLAWMPYIRLIAFIAAVVGGKMGMSPAELTRNLPPKE